MSSFSLFPPRPDSPKTFLNCRSAKISPRKESWVLREARPSGPAPGAVPDVRECGGAAETLTGRALRVLAAAVGAVGRLGLIPAPGGIPLPTLWASARVLRSLASSGWLVWVSFSLCGP